MDADRSTNCNQLSSDYLDRTYQNFIPAVCILYRTHLFICQGPTQMVPA